MRKVTADDKQVLGCKIRQQSLSHTFQFFNPLCSHNDRHNRRNALKPLLEKRQLHLQAMFFLMRLRQIAEHIVRMRQPFTCFLIDLDLSERSRISRTDTVDRGSVERCPVAGTQQKHAAVMRRRSNAGISLRSRSARKYIAGMGNNNGPDA